MRTLFLGVGLALMVLAACGPHASVSGLVNGKAFTAKSSGARIDSTNPAFKAVFVLVGESAETCNPAGGAPLWTSGTRGLELDFRMPIDGGATVTSGTFPGALTVFDAQCSTQTFNPAPAGAGDATVTVFSVSPTLNGSFTATLTSGGSLEGSFSSPLCEGIGSGAATCQFH